MTPQEYKLSGAQIPSQIPGAPMHSSRIGMDSTNCVKFTFWMVAKAFNLTFTPDLLKAWMVGKTMSEVPGYGPYATKQLGIATDAPGRGMHLVQFFRQKFQSYILLTLTLIILPEANQHKHLLRLFFPLSLQLQ